MYVVAGLWLPQTNVLRSQPYNITLVVHNTSSGTTCTDIDTNVVVLDDLDFIVRVDRHLARLLPRGLPEGHAALHDGQMPCCVSFVKLAATVKVPQKWMVV